MMTTLKPVMRPVLELSEVEPAAEGSAVVVVVGLRVVTGRVVEGGIGFSNVFDVDEQKQGFSDEAESITCQSCVPVVRRKSRYK